MEPSAAGIMIMVITSVFLGAVVGAISDPLVWGLRINLLVGFVLLLATGMSARDAAAAEPPARLAPGEVIAGRTTITLPDTIPYSSAERVILSLERERSGRIAARDTAWLATLYAPEFEAIVGNGRRIRRNDLFQIFGRDDPNSRFQIDELSVRAYSGAATVTGRLRFLGKDGAMAAETRYTHVYVQRDGHWWIVRAQATAVPASPPR